MSVPNIKVVFKSESLPDFLKDTESIFYNGDNIVEYNGVGRLKTDDNYKRILLIPNVEIIEAYNYLDSGNFRLRIPDSEFLEQE